MWRPCRVKPLQYFKNKRNVDIETKFKRNQTLSQQLSTLLSGVSNGLNIGSRQMLRPFDRGFTQFSISLLQVMDEEKMDSLTLEVVLYVFEVVFLDNFLDIF